MHPIAPRAAISQHGDTQHRIVHEKTYLDSARCFPPDTVERVRILDRVLGDGDV